jgi:phage/plasmid-associated DNA primase
MPENNMTSTEALRLVFENAKSQAGASFLYEAQQQWADAYVHAIVQELHKYFDEEAVVDPNATVLSSTLYERFKQWSIENGEEVISQKQFGPKLVERGFTRIRQAGTGKTAYRGIGILESDDCL